MDFKELSKLITEIENDPMKAREILKGRDLKDSIVVGITGNPGVGKSTLVDRLIESYRKDDLTVGVIAVDPSSPFSGGSFLGDRIRMKRHFTDDKVFIRSMASRGSLGGLNDAIFDVVNLMRAFKFDVIIVETVGAGQSEVEIAYVAHTVLLVLSPGGGDEIQLLKAGIVEIADIFVINKADQPGADALEMSIKAMLDISEIDGWKPPIVRTVATTGEGVDDLKKAIGDHRDYLIESGEMKKRMRRSLKKHAEHVITRKVKEILEKVEGEDVKDLIEKVVKEICRR